DRLARKCRPLLDPFQGLGGREGASCLLYDSHVEFLQDLSRGSELRRFDQFNGTFALALVSAGPYRRVDQNAGIKKETSVHAGLRGCRSSCRAGPATAWSVGAVAHGRGAPGLDVGLDS